MKHLNSEISYENADVSDPGPGTHSCFKLLPLWPIGLSHYEQWTKARLQGKDFWNDVCVCVCVCRMLRIAKKVTEEGLCPDLATSFTFVEF